MKQYLADITVNGKRTTDRRVEASNMDEAIALFKERLSPGETLVQVKGGHLKGEIIMPEASAILNYTK